MLSSAGAGLLFHAQRPTMSDPAFLGVNLVPLAATDATMDLELVEALRRKEPTAAAALWDRFSLQVRRVIRRSVGADDVEDLVQEVFLRLFNRLHTLREPAALTGFVLRVTTSVVISELRRKKVRRFLRLTREGELPEPATPAHDEDAREALRHLYRVLDGCGHEERMVFVLTEVEGMELAEVAAALNVSVATVKRRLSKLRARLLKAAGGDGAVRSALGLEAGGGRSAKPPAQAGSASQVKGAS